MSSQFFGQRTDECMQLPAIFAFCKNAYVLYIRCFSCDSSPVCTVTTEQCIFDVFVALLERVAALMY